MDTGSWVGCIALDDKGFVRTGLDLTPADLPASDASVARSPQSFEANWPGIFAVGEGSACVQQVHQALHD